MKNLLDQISSKFPNDENLVYASDLMKQACQPQPEGRPTPSSILKNSTLFKKIPLVQIYSSIQNFPLQTLDQKEIFLQFVFFFFFFPLLIFQFPFDNLIK